MNSVDIFKMILVFTYNLARINKGKVRDELQEGRNTFEDFIKLLESNKIKRIGLGSKEKM